MGQRNRPVVADGAAEMENVPAGRTGVLFRERRYLVGVDSAAPFCFVAGDCNTLRAYSRTDTLGAWLASDSGSGFGDGSAAATGTLIPQWQLQAQLL